MSVEKSEKVLFLCVDVAKAVVKAEADGQLGVEDIVYFVPLLAEISPAIQALSGLPAEISVLSVVDVMQLAEDVLLKLDGVVSSKVAGIVKQALVVAVESAKLISAIKS